MAGLGGSVVLNLGATTPSKADEARNRAADALARAQNVSVDHPRQQIAQLGGTVQTGRCGGKAPSNRITKAMRIVQLDNLVKVDGTSHKLNRPLGV
jgi:hypothetical protein